MPDAPAPPLRDDDNAVAVRAILAALQDRRIDFTLQALGEVIARILAATDADPEDSIVILNMIVREWLRCGGLSLRPAPQLALWKPKHPTVQ